MLDSGGGGGSGEAAGLFPYAEEEELSASPETIEDLADQIMDGRGNVQSINEDIDAAHLPALEATEGDIQVPVADATMPAKNNAERLLASTLCASGALRLFARDGVQAYNDKVDDIRSEYYRRKSEIMTSDQGVPAATYPENATAEERASIDRDRQDEIDEKRESAVNALVRELRQRQEGYKDDPLDAEAETCATRLKEGPTKENLQTIYSNGGLPLSAVEQLPSYELDRVPLNDWPPELADASDQEKADWLLEHPELGSVLAINASDEVKRLVGEGLANAAREIDHDSSAEEIQRLNNQLTHLGLGVRAQFVKALGGDGTVQLISRLGQNALGNNDSAEAARTLAFTVKHSVEIASTFLKANEAREIANEMVDAVEHNETMQNQSVALSFLLRDGNYGTEFLDTMGDRLDAFERSDHFEVGGWNRMQMGPNGVNWFFAEDAREAAFDPMASYMTALGNNDEAALQFFTEGGEDENGVDRQEYWIQKRLWSHDDFTGLLAALDAATTGEDNLDDPESAEKAARLMSSTVDLLANRDKLDHYGSGEDFNPDDVSAEGTEHLAHMIGTYMQSVDLALEMQERGDTQTGEVTQIPGGGRFGDGLANMPIFEADELKEIVTVTVSKNEGMAAMREMVSAYQGYQMHQSIDEHGYIAPEYSNADARIEGFFVNAVGDSKIAEAAGKDEAIQTWLDLGSGVAGSIPVPGGKFVEFVASNAIDITADQVADGLTKNEDREVDAQNDYAVAALNARKEAFAAALVNSGAITADDVYEALPPNSPYSREDVEGWFPNGKYPSKEQFEAMDGSEQNALKSIVWQLMSRDPNPDNPDDHPLVDLNEYNQNYKDMFSEYFEKGDGDGN